MSAASGKPVKATSIRSRALQGATDSATSELEQSSTGAFSATTATISQPSASLSSRVFAPRRFERDTTNYDEDEPADSGHTDSRQHVSFAADTQDEPVVGRKRHTRPLSGVSESKGGEDEELHEEEEVAKPAPKRKRKSAPDPSSDAASEASATQVSGFSMEQHALIPIGGTEETGKHKGPLVDRPVAVTKWGLRQFVETENGVRLFLQNCVATCNLKCNPDLPHIATHARNAEYNPKRFSGLIMRLREPKSTALVFSTGKVCLTGVRNEDDGREALRKVAKIVAKLGFSSSFTEFKVQNLVATGDCGFPIRLEGIADEHSKFSSYEPELFSGLVYRMENPKIVFLVFVSGKIVVTGAKTRSAMLEGVDKLYPVLFKYRKTPSMAPAMPDEELNTAI